MTKLNKEELEKRKLLIEIAQLEQKWWKKPAYMAAFFPTLLAIITLGAGLYSGYIKNEYKLLELTKERIAANQEEIMTQQKQLEAEKTNYINEKNSLKQKVAQLQEEMSIGNVAAHIIAIKEKGEDLWPLHNSFEPIINSLKTDHRAVVERMLAEIAENDSGVILKGNLYLILYQGTGDQKWKHKLFTLSNKQRVFESWRFWHIYGSARGFKWSEKDSIEIIEMVADLLIKANITESQKSDLLSVVGHQASNISFSSDSNEIMSKFNSSERFFTIISNSRDILLNSKAQWTSRVDSMKALSKLSPYAFIALLPQIIVKGEQNKKILSYIEDAINIDKGGTIHVGKQAARLRTPLNTDIQSWKIWTETHEDLVALIIESDLHTWRTNNNRLYELVN